jgi:hypothetical protein
MQLELSHSKRLGRTVNTTWDKFVFKYLMGIHSMESDRVYKELCTTGRSKLTDEDGTLYIEVAK